MGYDGKYGKVTTEHGDIPDDEPVIVFRARDMHTVPLLSYYLMKCAKGGSPKRHLNIVIAAIERFRTWQFTHETKSPDSERSRAWLGE